MGPDENNHICTTNEHVVVKIETFSAVLMSFMEDILSLLNFLHLSGLPGNNSYRVHVSRSELCSVRFQNYCAIIIVILYFKKQQT